MASTLRSRDCSADIDTFYIQEVINYFTYYGEHTYILQVRQCKTSLNKLLRRVSYVAITVQH